MQFDRGDGKSRRTKHWHQRLFAITLFAGIPLIGLIVFVMIYLSANYNGYVRVLSLLLGGFLILLIALSIYLAYRRLQNPNGKLLSFVGLSSHKTVTDGQFPKPPEGLKAFTYEELVKATDGYSPSNLLGEGGFGTVYKGTIAGDLMAVKQLKIGGGQGEREFRAEVDIISRVHHRHLVSLLGHCISNSQRLLVYNFVPNGTLYEALHGPGKPVMDWATRMTIAVGAARGLAYLHDDCHPRIIHRDIKGQNILLDNQWQAQVADFGLAKLFDDAKSHVTTRVMGTFGYVAPEYAMSGKLTDKSDVYSFGVVLLELITGKKHVFEMDGDKVSLVEWARPLLNQALGTQNVDAFVDPKLMNNYDKKEMFRMVEVAATCVRHSAERRPKMAVVLRALDTQHADDLHQGGRPGSNSELLKNEAKEEFHLVSGTATAESSTDYDLGV
ncbi:unnamed protein product [Calypogeia fissa]